MSGENSVARTVYVAEQNNLQLILGSLHYRMRSENYDPRLMAKNVPPLMAPSRKPAMQIAPGTKRASGTAGFSSQPEEKRPRQESATRPPNAPSGPKNFFRHSYLVHVSDHVPKATKAMIHNHKDVELESLLREQQKPADDCDNENLAEPTKKITNFSEWHTCFLIFVDIYVQKYPERVWELLEYISKMQRYSEEFEVTFEYEKRRRAKICASNGELSWAEFDIDLLDRVKEEIRGKASKFPQNQGELQKQGQKSREYNRQGMRCHRPNCWFRHICYKCGGNHPRYRCDVQNCQDSQLKV